MCSPIGHSLAALAVGTCSRRQKLNGPFLLFCLFSGNAADLDLLVGWFLKNINRYHHLGSHSIFAAVAFGILIYGIALVLQTTTGIRLRWSISGALMYLSHVLLDLISRDESVPIGLRLLWPFSEEFYIAPFLIFRKFLHDTVGADMWGMVIGLFNGHNLYTIIQETLILLPILLICLRLRSYKNKEDR